MGKQPADPTGEEGAADGECPGTALEAGQQGMQREERAEIPAGSAAGNAGLRKGRLRGTNLQTG